MISKIVKEVPRLSQPEEYYTVLYCHQCRAQSKLTGDGFLCICRDNKWKTVRQMPWSTLSQMRTRQKFCRKYYNGHRTTAEKFFFFPDESSFWLFGTFRKYFFSRENDMSAVINPHPRTLSWILSGVKTSSKSDFFKHCKREKLEVNSMSTFSWNQQSLELFYFSKTPSTKGLSVFYKTSTRSVSVCMTCLADYSFLNNRAQASAVKVEYNSGVLRTPWFWGVEHAY